MEHWARTGYYKWVILIITNVILHQILVEDFLENIHKVLFKILMLGLFSSKFIEATHPQIFFDVISVCEADL